MAVERARMELPVVRGWRRPAVDIPLFELSDWEGPRWLLIYQGLGVIRPGEEDHLQEVTFAFGDVDDQPARQSWIDVTTYAKMPEMLHESGARTMATSFASVASGVLTLLIERVSSGLKPESEERQRRELSIQLARDGAFTIRSEELPADYWTPIELTVDGTATAGYATALLDGWAVCVDQGSVYVSASGNGLRPESLAFQRVLDLRPYRMPGLSE